MSLSDIIDEHYRSDIQMSAGQIYAIGSAIRSAGPGASVLIFGCGNDSNLWNKINDDGSTVFIEDAHPWIDKMRTRHPELNIEEVSYGDRTVESSLPIDEDALADYPIPECMLSRQWDVIVIDSPRGHKPWLPGRSLPIYWSYKVAQPDTQVFIDDCSRQLEKIYADYFFCSRRPWSVVVPRIVQAGKPVKASLLWVFGIRDGVQVVGNMPKVEQSSADNGSGAAKRSL